ncbi:MAG TPA: S-layer homology domain-containing protein, partial [Thermoclostridium sp.]|nr:S-layer homology domain-containing protein [Thermoclostridium sp.]
MKRVCKRIIPLCLVLLFSAVFIVSAYAMFKDVASHWAEDIIVNWADKGVVKGMPDGSFKPDANITRAEFITIVDNVMNYANKSEEQFIDVPTNEWYADNVAKAVAAGVTVGIGNNMFDPSNNITRQEAAVMLYRAFNMQVEDQSASDKFADTKLIASWAKDAVNALAENKYILGRPGNRFAPNENITRAETLKIVDNILDDIINTTGTYSKNISKGLLINTADVTLKDMAISGNLYISEGVDNGNVVLDGVTIKGDLVIYGGGENSITLTNTQVEGTMYVLKYDGKIRIIAQGNTVINDTSIRSGVILEEEGLTSTGFSNLEVISIDPGENITLDGDFDEVIVDAPGVSIHVENGVVATLYISDKAAGASIEVREGGIVNLFDINAASTIKGKGKIDKAEIKANRVSIETEPDLLLIHKNYTANIGGKAREGDYIPGQEDTPTPTPTKDPAPIGGGSGGGGNGDDDSLPQIAPSKIYLTVGGVSVEGKIKDSKTATFDLSGQDNSKRVSSLKIVATPQSARLVTSKVNIIPISREIEDISNISVSGLLGTGKESVSLGTLRGLFGKTITIEGTLKKSGYEDLKVSLTIDLGTEEGTYPSDYLELIIDGNTITAAIKPGTDSTKLSQVGISALMNGLFGATPDKVSIDNKEWYSVANESAKIQGIIANLGGGKSWSNVTLGDLANKQVFFKKSEASGTVFTVNIIKSNDYAYIRTSDTTVTAQIKDGKGDTPVSGIGITNFLREMTSNSILHNKVSVDKKTWYEVDGQNSDIASAIVRLAGAKSWSELELNDLKGKTIYFKIINDVEY